MKKIKILVCQHKEAEVISDDIYTPIQVGKALSKINLGILGDDTGENISKKNGSYCELTALYWAWKNMKDIDIIGLCHYRRYFSRKVTKDVLQKVFSVGKFDMIVCKSFTYFDSNFNTLSYEIGKEDSFIMLDSVLKIHPECYQALYEYGYLSNKWIPCNMFISSYETLDEYCNWLFPVLNDIENRMKISPYSRARRALGYMGEFLLGLFLTSRRSIKVLSVEMKCLDNIGNKKTMRSRLSYFRGYFAYKITHIKSLRLFRLLNRREYLGAFISVPPSVLVGLKNDGIYLTTLEKYPLM